MKRITYIPIVIFMLTITITNNAHAIVSGTAVSDFETHNKINITNKYLLDQKDIINSNGESLIEIKNAIMGNNSNAYSVISNESFSLNISDIKVPNILKGKEIRIINKNLDVMYPIQELEIPENEMARMKQKQQQQSELKQIIIYTTNIINNSETRDSEIETLVRESSQTRQLKEAMDLQNKIALENLIELKKNNILLASFMRSQAKEKYSGLINIKPARPQSDAEEYQKSGFRGKYPNSKYNRMLGY
ncbi:hypothetical protein ACFL0U_04515 [Pseudomonadota bacterium]